jgi:anthranilate synthase component 1
MPHRCRKRLDDRPDLLRLSEACPERFPYLLESAARGGLGSCSILPYASGERLTIRRGRDPRGPGQGAGFLDRLESWYRLEQTGAAPQSFRDEGIPFAGGWFLFLGYEMAGEIEPGLRMPANESGLPDAIAHRCHGAVVAVHGQAPAGDDRVYVVAESREMLDEIVSCVTECRVASRSVPAGPNPVLEELVADDPSRFIDSIHRIHEYLAAGDVFQVNVSRGWSGSFSASPDPVDLYHSLRLANPAPFAGLMRWRDQVLLSSSPERLVQVRGRRVQTRPIAGTRPRGVSDGQDRALSEELLGNLKERAEHIMLIDLERNDLGRVCKPGSIEVNELMVVESYAHVHHIVSNVRGQLRDGASPIDAVRAVFPGGTITGCPKVRCMEIISELEGRGRGFYTGSMGYLGTDGSMDMNILIRSLLLTGPRFSFRTGAGIVADSVPEREVDETGDKARGILLALESHGRERKHA